MKIIKSVEVLSFDVLKLARAKKLVLLIHIINTGIEGLDVYFGMNYNT
ncbi:MAG TPA: hypothetical protein VE467_10730 [Chryseolinea sp.]|nr:hypothetical protein [Chryseolinea sp.]